MRIYLDDHLKPLSSHWTVVKTVEEFKKIVIKYKNNIKAISLDHDLGDETTSGMDAARFIIENKIYPEWINIHSMNPVGASNMLKFIKNNAPENTKVTRVFIKAEI